MREEFERSALGVRKECAKPELKGSPGVRPDTSGSRPVFPS